MELNYGYTIIEVQADSCANCITMMPIIRTIANRRNDLTVLNLPLNEITKDLLGKYEITSVPTTLFLYNDQLLGKVSGLQPEEILEIWIDSKIEEHVNSVK